MFLFHHAIIVDMLVDAPETPSITPITGIRGSIFARHISQRMINDVTPSAPLYRGAVDGMTSIIKMEHRRNVNELDEAMNGACEGGHFDLVKAEIERNGADVNENALCASCRSGNITLVNFLIATIRGFHLVMWNGCLVIACCYGHRDVAKLMIQRGANSWNNAMHSACWGGHGGLVDLLISRGANGWNFGLMGACEGRHKTLVAEMIERGATRCGWCGWAKDEEMPHPFT